MLNMQVAAVAYVKERFPLISPLVPSLTLSLSLSFPHSLTHSRSRVDVGLRYSVRVSLSLCVCVCMAACISNLAAVALAALPPCPQSSGQLTRVLLPRNIRSTHV